MVHGPTTIVVHGLKLIERGIDTAGKIVEVITSGSTKADHAIKPPTPDTTEGNIAVGTDGSLGIHRDDPLEPPGLTRRRLFILSGRIPAVVGDDADQPLRATLRLLWCSRDS